MNERRLPWLFLAPALILIFAITLYPLVYSLTISFQNYDINRSAETGIQFIGLGNYINLFKDPLFWNSLKLSMIYVVGSVTGSLLLGFGLALLLDRELRGMTVLRSLLIIPMVVTPVSIGLTWRMMFSDAVGIINFVLRAIGLPYPLWIESTNSALVSVMLVDIWEWTPFMFLIILAGLRSLPISPFESAMVDGATWPQRLRYLTIPMLKPVFYVAIILRTVDALRMFDQVFIMTRGGPAQATDLFSLFVYRVGFKLSHMSYAAALSWILLFMSTVLLVFFVNSTGMFKRSQPQIK
jgi:multiple sugar transport system permease protein